MTRARLSPAAISDIRDIRRYSKPKFGVAATRTYLEGLTDTFALVQERPFTGKREVDLPPDVRSFSYGSHRIYYRLLAETIEVLRVLHHAQDRSALRNIQ